MPDAPDPEPFEDRGEAGELLASRVAALVAPSPGPLLVYGLARGGVPVAARVARRLGAPLDALAVRKIGHPLRPELALGAVAAGGPVVMARPPALARASRDRLAAEAAAAAARLDARLHAETPALDPEGAACVLVDDGLATGASMVAACRWARSAGARRVIAAAPVASREGADALRAEADQVVCVHEIDRFIAVGAWYRDFGQVDEGRVLACLRAARAAD
ncbi:MAG: phosphoribosyltransferase [Thermoleophilia bacterium]